MKRKSISRTEPDILTLEAVGQADRSLPKPHGCLPRTGKLTVLERRELEAAFRAQQTAQSLGQKRKPKIRNPSDTELRQLQAEREQLRLDATKHLGGLIPTCGKVQQETAS